MEKKKRGTASELLLAGGGGLLLLGLERLEAVVQLGDDLGLGDAEAVAGRDVARAVLANGGVLTAQAAHAQAIRLADGLGLGIRATLGEVGQGDVDRSAHARAEIGGARGDDTIVRRHGEGEAGDLLDDAQGGVQAIEDLIEDRALLHAHDAQVVLLADPDDEGLVARHIAAAAKRPVGGDAGGGQVVVSRHVLEHDVLLDERVVLLVVDEVRMTGGQRVVAAAVLGQGDQLLEGLAHLLLHVDAIILGHGAGQREVRQVAADTHAHGQRGQTERAEVQLTALREAGNALEAPVVDVLLVGGDLVVVGQHQAEEGLVEVVVLGLHGIATHATVGILNARAADLEQPLLARIVQGVEVGHAEMLGHAVVGEDLLDEKDTRDGLGVRTLQGLLDLIGLLLGEAHSSLASSVSHK
eukprot:m.224306 g.224306  ORF g.224306 m.224306 type:complete len:412 (-) comp11077_c0_seq1:31-1266(-)